LKGGKETSDLAEYFQPFKTQMGPKIQKMASDYFSASLLTAKQVRSSVTKTGGPLPVCKTWCGANLKHFFLFFPHVALLYFRRVSMVEQLHLNKLFDLVLTRPVLS